MDRPVHSAEEIQKKFDTLPLEVQTLIYSPEMLGVIKGVGEKYHLHLDQLDLLEADTGEVMLGFLETKDYPEALMESLGVDRVKAEAIAQDINNQLFIKIREAMQKPVPAPVAPAPAVVVAVAPIILPVKQDAKKTELHSAELMLSGITVSKVPPVSATPPATPSQPIKPSSYKTDPYREQPE